MRSLLKYLPLLLTLLIPLALLAWFGSRELTRLEDHSASLLQAEAHRFLRNEEEQVRFEIERVADVSLNEAIGDALSDPSLTIVEASKQLSAKPFILHAFVADKNFELIAPRPAKVKRPSAPLAELPEAQDSRPQRELWTAEILCDLNDDAGAIQALESYIKRFEDSQKYTEGLMWAYFRLAGLLDKLTQTKEDREAVILAYWGAQVAAGRTCERTPTSDAATVILLTKLREHQVQPNPERMLDLLHQIGSARQDHIDYVSEDVLEWVVGDIVNHIRADNPKMVEHRDQYLALNRVRVAQRSFANDYEDRTRTQLALDHRNKRLHTYKNIIFQALTTSQGTDLLVMRPANQNEQRRHGGTTAWVGLLLDLPALIGFSPRSTPGNVALSVLDPSGVALLESHPPVRPGDDERPAIRFTPVVSSLARLEFVAIPSANPTDLLSEARNQGVLILILVVVALAGAFMLIRSVKHETELAQTKVTLLSRVGHELKTPLAVIKMYGETLGLGRTKDQGQVSRFAGIIASECDRLTGMVERILDFSNMAGGTFKYDKRRIDVGEVVEVVAEEYLPHIESQGLDLKTDVAHGLEADIDPRGLTSSLVNLLENALKYTPEDAPERTIDITLARQNGRAILEVRDRGVGIPADELDRVFTDFYRASNAGEVRGAGIGLSLVDHFARSHNGMVEALSRTDGAGTTMRLTLPLTASDSAHTES